MKKLLASLLVLCLPALASAADAPRPIWTKVEVENFQAAPGTYKIPINLSEPAGIARRNEALRFGVPIPRGVLKDLASLRLEDETGAPRPIQAETAAYWPDGSIKWVVLDTQLDSLPASAKRRWSLSFGAGVKPVAQKPGVQVKEDDDTITIDTSKLKAILLKNKNVFIQEAWLDRNANGKYEDSERIVAPIARGELRGLFVDLYNPKKEAAVISEQQAPSSGRGPYWAALDPAPSEVKVEAAGPVCAEICIKGWHRAQFGRDAWTFVAPASFQYVLRMRFYANSSTVRVYHTFINTEDPVDVRVKSIGIKLPVSLSGPLRHSFGSDPVLQADADQTTGHYLVQDNWNNFTLEKSGPMPALQPVAGGDPAPLLGNYQGGVILKQGQAAQGWSDVSSSDAGLTLIFRDMQKLFPKELGFEGPVTYAYAWPAHKRPTQYDYFPGGNKPYMDLRQPTQIMAPQLQRFKDQYPALYQQYVVGQDSDWERYQMVPDRCNAIGVSKTHEIIYDFHAGPVDPVRAAALSQAVSAPIQPYVTPQWYCWATEALGRMQPYDPVNFPLLETQFQQFSDWLYKHQNQWSHFWGIFDYGSFQTAYQPGKTGFAKGYPDDSEFGPWGKYLGRFGWLNAEYNNDYDIWLQYFRTGRYQDFQLARAYSAQHMDVDTCHYHPNPEWVGAQHRHSILHWSDWLVDQQTYNDGMAALYFATGDRRARDTTLLVGQFSMFPRIADRYFLEIEGSYSTIKYQEHRGTWCRIANISRMYEITADPKVKRYLANYAKAVQDNLEPTGGPRDTNGSTDYVGIAFPRWYEATQDPAVKKIIVDTGFTLLAPGVLGTFGPYTALRYQLTGDDGPLAVAGLSTAQRIGYNDAEVENLRARQVKPDTFTSARTTPFLGDAHLMSAVYDARYTEPAVSADRLAPKPRPDGSLYKMVDLTAQMTDDAFGDMSTGHPLPWPQKPQSPNLRQTLSKPGARVFFKGSGTSGLADDQNIANILAPGQVPWTNWSIYPFYEFEYPMTRQNAPPPSALMWDDVPFSIADSRQNAGKSMIGVKAGQSVKIPLNLKARRLYFLGHVFALRYTQALTVPPLNVLLSRAPLGAYKVNYADGTSTTVPIVNRLNAAPWIYGVPSEQAPFVYGSKGNISNVWPGQGGVCAFELDVEPKPIASIEFTGSDPNKELMLYALTALIDTDSPASTPLTFTFQEQPAKTASSEAIGITQTAGPAQSGWVDPAGLKPNAGGVALPVDGVLRTLRLFVPKDGWYLCRADWRMQSLVAGAIVNGRYSHNANAFFAQSKNGIIDIAFHLRKSEPYNNSAPLSTLISLQLTLLPQPPPMIPLEVNLDKSLKFGWDSSEPFLLQAGCLSDATLRIDAPPGKYKVTIAFTHPFGPSNQTLLNITPSSGKAVTGCVVLEDKPTALEATATNDGLKIRIAVNAAASQGRLQAWALSSLILERIE